MVEELSIEELNEIVNDALCWNVYALNQRYHSLLYRITSKVQEHSSGIVSLTSVVDAANVELMKRSMMN